MRAHHIGHGPGMAAPEAAASICVAGAASAFPDAVAHAELNAQKESAPAAQAAQSQEQDEPRDSATGVSADKAFFTLRAQLTLAGGFTLLELADGSFLVTQWNCCRPLTDLCAVAAFVRQVGGAPHG